MSTPAIPAVPASASQSQDWLVDIPGGDTPFDDLFTGGEPSTPAPASPAPAAAPQVPAAATPPASEPFLKAGNTVYKTREEAERSLAYKDEVVERLRQTEIQRTGIDPLTGKAVPVAPQGPVSYRQNHKKYVEDLSDSLSKNDLTRYYETQQKLIFDVLEPISPIIADFTRSQALAAVASEIKDFPVFRQSKDWTDTLEALPDLKQAIELAENDLNYANRLPQFYKTAYWAAQGRRTPELVQSATQVAVQQTQNQPATRPTTTPSTMTPPATAGARQSFSTSEGRKAIMEALKDKIEDVVW